MLIKHRGVYHDRLDAPFVGSLVFAMDCHNNCRGCCHADRHKGNYYIQSTESIIQSVKDYRFSEGIILGGFEWTEQYEELVALIEEALRNDLKVILYTHLTESEMMEEHPDIYRFRGIYIKYGEYRESEKVEGYQMYGVALASKNQYIVQI